MSMVVLRLRYLRHWRAPVKGQGVVGLRSFHAGCITGPEPISPLSRWRCDMARDGYLILDSDLHMMEPDDLWARYLEGQHRANLPRFFGGQQRKLSESSEDKGNADAIMGMEVQGLAIPAHANATGATASSRELRRRSRARHPHFQVARGRGFDPESTLTAMDIEGVDVAVMYGTRGRPILAHGR